MAPREPVWPLDPHTKAKHELLRHYLGAWFPILSSSGRQRIVFLDGFAGPGIYKGGEPGSPIIALDVLLGHPHFGRWDTEFVFLFLEPHAQRYASLREQLELRRQRQGDWPANVRVHTSDVTFEAWAESILATLDQQRKSLAPTFAFVDPFGFSAARLDLLCRLLASIFHEAMCVNVLAWFACACRIDERYRLGGLATPDRTHDAVATAPEGGRSAGR